MMRRNSLQKNNLTSWREDKSRRQKRSALNVLLLKLLKLHKKHLTGIYRQLEPAAGI